MRWNLLFMLIAIAYQSASQEVTVTAHRGASGSAPENTLAAVRKALETGVDRIEVDVQQTSDGVVICLHDESLDRTTDRIGRIADRSWDEVRKASASNGMTAYSDEPIPTLEQVFQLMDGSVEFVIEIKEGSELYPGIESRVVQMIRDHQAERWAIVHSFNDRVLDRIDGSDPDIRLQKLFVAKVTWLPIMIDFKLHFHSLDAYRHVEAFGCHKRFVTEPLVRHVHDLGKKLHVFTVNEPDEMTKLMEWGVDGIISNFPEKANEVRAGSATQ